ncbi:MAG: hypothetical protein CMK09_08905 [Ponticaulis sp.]|nr:hypothetical protein [Ponticaulis sp.]|tara:strand:+ start:5258 stop:6586 length:1329 start_codon:yes stop_codon:yes gene_type:complete
MSNEISGQSGRFQIPAIGSLLVLAASALMFGGDNTSSSLLVSFCVLLIFAVSMLRHPALKLEPWHLPIIFGFSVFSIYHFFAGNMADAEHEYLMLIAAAGVFWIGRTAAKSKRRFFKVARYIAVYALLYSGAAFFQHFLMPDTVLGLEKPYHHLRLTGSFLSANTAASYFAILSLFLFARILQNLSKSSRYYQDVQGSGFRTVLVQPVTLSALIFALTCLFLTGSRAGIASGVAGLSVVFAGYLIAGIKSQQMGSGWGKFLIVSGLMAVGMMLFVWILSGGVVQSRVFDFETDLDQRISFFGTAWEAGQQYPFFGAGLDNWQDARFESSGLQTNASIVENNAVHNLYIQWFVQGGWVGLTGMISLVVAVALRAWFSDQHTIWKAFAFGVLTVVLLHGLFDYAMEIPAFFLLVAFLLGLTTTEAGPAGRQRDAERDLTDKHST